MEIKHFDFLFEKELLSEMEQFKTIKKFKENDIIIEAGQEIALMPFVLSGAIKVLKEDKNGDDLLLYYLEAGDTCTMTISCCLGKTKSRIKAIAEENTEILFLPMEKSTEWITKYKSWRDFIFTSYETKYLELLDAIDSLAFMNLEDRIKKYLIDKAKIHGDLNLHATHQQIADDLHSSRVVISRLLKKLEHDGFLNIQRNSITLSSI